jgi:hypothetical protein
MYLSKTGYVFINSLLLLLTLNLFIQVATFRNMSILNTAYSYPKLLVNLRIVQLQHLYLFQEDRQPEAGIPANAPVNYIRRFAMTALIPDPKCSHP